MAQRFRAARARASRRPSSRQAGDARELIHDLHNSLAAMSLWLDTLLEQPCPQCRGARDEVAAGIFSCAPTPAIGRLGIGLKADDVSAMNSA